MDYPGNSDDADGNQSPPWDNGTKKRKTSRNGNNTGAGRRATAATEEAELYNRITGNYLAPAPPAAEVVIASNPFDDSHRPQYNQVPPPHLPQQLVAAPPWAPPPQYPYGFAPQTTPRFEQPMHARPPQNRGSRAKPKSRVQTPPYPGNPGPIINTKSRMLMGGGHVNVQQPDVAAGPSVNGLGMPPVPSHQMYEARPGPNLLPPPAAPSQLDDSLDDAMMPPQPGLQSAIMPPPMNQPLPGSAAGKSARKRKICLTSPPVHSVQPCCPPVDCGRDAQTHYQPPMSQLDPCYIDSLPYNDNGLAAPILRGQLTLPAMQAPEEQRPRSPQLLDECAGCRDFVYSNEEPIWCRASCGLVYHRRCTDLYETAHYLMTNVPNAAWICQTCEKNQPDIEWIKFGQ